ncbi:MULTISPECIES: fumarylacetoacetate hydrolase family protein [Rhodococcus]|jgi:2-keto-4-pentenoate hydratase/2-oxohepta-3-ene-1,7-dioic acid hydratase in catechol pathway|uniref:Fumarylacetoacetate hydrolase family protein n=1 Tax=Rhodococcus oxybenzonivorans TaxID=1990687 RepID=A0AAE4UZ12_9NOCA|nr:MULTISPECIES: fumarylacetoacetate hydrolase family protein [Rhodococcus]MDV7243494.1 fumarylacetoacetate hydrolase family protein [Rhodococcus oxybenzonivorans]MDV7265201.1 fumarylacetoacetate hydrolase family protein [Rhodococcus oxybenzonivorans]MDV7277470.1 fumarylacetoacetate hydrolase family protein [Rhodococcus oxybenzonivorans]MDV7335502.1 fumarylacetoacetate hydrolase family protein [Rhodococcus oxybenzonivorans]MDV7347182.1 fumarylacetoacetate hydrolase family protein [Rhodococcus 
MRVATVEHGGDRRTVVLDADGRSRDVTGLTGVVAADVDIEKFASLTEQDLRGCPLIDLDEITRWLPPVTDPRRILCVGFNYHNHAVEMDKEPPRYPTFFVRFPSSLVGHGEPIERSPMSDSLDWEGEIAIVIGRGGRNIRAEDAADHIWGYTAFADNSVREYQLHGTQATAGKNFDRSGSIGPWLVTSDEIADPKALRVQTYLGDSRVQSGVLADLVFDVPTVIEYVSTWTTLTPGDIIATGTPAGIGFRQDPPRYLQPGEVLTIDIPGVTRLVNHVR